MAEPPDAAPRPGLPPGTRLIKRYANRKLYDTGVGALISLRHVERLVRDGVKFRVVDNHTGADLTGEVLVHILGNSIGRSPADDDIALLTALIRSPDDVLRGMFRDQERTEELRAMRDRVRALSATLDVLLSQMDRQATPAPGSPPPPARSGARSRRPSKAAPTGAEPSESDRDERR